MANLRKILAIKFFRIAHQIHNRYGSLFVKPFSSRLLQISTVFNYRFKVNPSSLPQTTNSNSGAWGMKPLLAARVRNRRIDSRPFSP